MKAGDKLVCVNIAPNYIELIKDNVYTVKGIYDDDIDGMSYIILEELINWYPLFHFAPLVDLRKDKILKIKQRICLK